MIHVSAFIEKEKICITETKKSGVEAAEKSNRDKKREYAHGVPVEVEPIPRPRMNPGKSVILEQEARMDPGRSDLVTQNPDLANHQQAEGDSKENERSNINGRESAVL